MSSSKVILTGLRAKNDLHLGNYFGALLPIVDLAKNHSDKFKIHFFVPDLHSFTTPIDHTKLQQQILLNLRLFVAAGLPLGNPNIFLYRQSFIPAHSELTMILNCFASMGELERMTQYKDKSSKISQDTISAGLFDYPVLMASDILLYHANYVPVGDDQSQHLEFIRNLAKRMNSKFGKIFTVPEPVEKQHALFGKDHGLRIMDLQKPDNKMSKSGQTDKGGIFLTDKPEDAYKKIMGATTDNFGEVKYDRANQPGISNLLQIYALLSGQTLQKTIDQFSGAKNYSEFKKQIADLTKIFLVEFQNRFDNVDTNNILRKTTEDEKHMALIANRTLSEVQKAIGLRN